MGYDKELVVEALRQTDNDYDIIERLLEKDQELLRISSNKKFVCDQSLLSHFLSMGFNENDIRGQLKKNKNNSDDTLNALLNLDTTKGEEENYKIFSSKDEEIVENYETTENDEDSSDDEESENDEEDKIETDKEREERELEELIEIEIVTSIKEDEDYLEETFSVEKSMIIDFLKQIEEKIQF